MNWDYCKVLKWDVQRIVPRIVLEEKQTVQKVYDEGFARVTVRKIKIRDDT